MNKSLRPKKLSFDEMWQLYKLLGSVQHTEEFAIKEIQNILDRITNDQFLSCLSLMGFPKEEDKNPLKVAVYFTSGIVRNRFFDFGEFMRGLNGST